MVTTKTAPMDGIDLLYKPHEVNWQKNSKDSVKKGFSILDFLVILSAFFVIAFLGYLVLNPSKQGAEERNLHRSADLSTILTSVLNYASKKGDIPESIPLNRECVAVGNEICRIGPYNCKGLVDLAFLADDTEDPVKVLTLPVDPANKSVNGTGYYISHDGEGNITVCAPYAERNVEISFTKFVF